LWFPRVETGRCRLGTMGFLVQWHSSSHRVRNETSNRESSPSSAGTEYGSSKPAIRPKDTDAALGPRIRVAVPWGRASGCVQLSNARSPRRLPRTGVSPPPPPGALRRASQRPGARGWLSRSAPTAWAGAESTRSQRCGRGARTGTRGGWRARLVRTNMRRKKKNDVGPTAKLARHTRNCLGRRRRRHLREASARDDEGLATVKRA